MLPFLTLCYENMGFSDFAAGNLWAMFSYGFTLRIKQSVPDFRRKFGTFSGTENRHPNYAHVHTYVRTYVYAFVYIDP